MTRKRYDSSSDGFLAGDESGVFAPGDSGASEASLPTASEQGSRGVLVLTSSYGLSALIHLGFIVIALFVYWTKTPTPAEAHTLVTNLEPKQQEYDPEKKRALHTKPEIKHPDRRDQVVKPLEEEVEKATEMPKGTSLSNQANKNLDATSVVDAMGPGGGRSGSYGQRWGKPSLGKNGGDDESESAVLAALWWLQRHQDPDGKWSSAGFHRNCDLRKGACSGADFRTKSGLGPGSGDPRYDVGVTALALLAFLGNGHNHRVSKVPEFKIAVKRGLQFLRGKQASDGSCGFKEGEDMYNHTIATMALCEAYDTSRDFTLKRVAQRSVDWLIQAQNPTLGWRYGVQTGRNDTSVTGWAVLALKAAKHGKLKVPQSAFEGALAWFERVTSGGGKNRARGLVGYLRSGDGGSMINRSQLEYPRSYPRFAVVPTMTGVATICRIFTGQTRHHERVKQGLKILMQSLPTWDGAKTRRKNKTNFYYWYYGTYAAFQATKLHSKEWARWNKAMQTALIGDGTGRQRKGRDACEDGSWDPIGQWGLSGGRVYATAINALTLEIYYRYERVAEATAPR